MKTSKKRKSMYSKSSKPKDTLNMTKVSKIVSKSIHRSFVLAKVGKDDSTGSKCIEAAKKLANSLAATEEGALVVALDDSLRAAGYFGTKEHQLAVKAFGKLTEGRQLLDELVTSITNDMEEKAAQKAEQENFTKDLPKKTADGEVNDVDLETDEDDNLDNEMKVDDLEDELNVDNDSKKKSNSKVKPKHPGAKVEKKLLR